MNSDNKKHTLPQWPFHFLRRICPDHLYEEIEGDLIQKFNRDPKNFGERGAKRRMVWNAIRFFRLGILLRSRFSMQLNQGPMYRSYFKIMIRNMLKQKFYSAITILGLTVGITFAMLIGIFIWGELQFLHLNRDMNFDASFNLLNKFNFDYGKRMGKFYLFVSASLNYFLYQPEDAGVYKIRSVVIQSGNFGSLSTEIWPGYAVGIQF